MYFPYVSSLDICMAPKGKPLETLHLRMGGGGGKKTPKIYWGCFKGNFVFFFFRLAAAATPRRNQRRGGGGGGGGGGGQISPMVLEMLFKGQL